MLLLFSLSRYMFGLFAIVLLRGGGLAIVGCVFLSSPIAARASFPNPNPLSPL